MFQKHLLFLAALPLVLGVTAAGAPRAVAAPAVAVFDGDDHDDHDDNGPTILVDNDKVQCPQAAFMSIQAAVTAAPPGAVIEVCPGTYPETVRIAKPLTVRGIRVGNENLVLINPATAAANTSSLFSGAPVAAIVLVERTSNVTLDNLTVDGVANLINACAPNFVGIFYRNASGKVTNSVVRNIRLFPEAVLGGCQSGIGIFAQSGDEPGARRGSRLEVSNTSVHDYQKNGITGNERGTELYAFGNAVTGLGTTPIIAQNGIQIGFDAKGQIEGNSVINHVYSLCTTIMNCGDTASSILVFAAGSGVRVSRNNVGKSQVNIYFSGEDASTPITNGLIEGNTVFDSDVFDGVAIVNGNNNTVRGNTIFNSDEASVFVQGDRNRITDNTFNEAPVGVLVGVGTNNQISGNRYYNIEQRVLPPQSSSRESLRAESATTTGMKVNPVRP